MPVGRETTSHPHRGFAARRLRTAARGVATLAALVLLGGCVYRLAIQQGNLVDPDNLQKVEVGMTRSQVQFLLGTPMVADSFHQDRWDYPYYLRTGHRHNVKKSWFAVYFKNDRVVRVDRNLDQRADSSKGSKAAKAPKASQS